MSENSTNLQTFKLRLEGLALRSFFLFGMHLTIMSRQFTSRIYDLAACLACEPRVHRPVMLFQFPATFESFTTFITLILVFSHVISPFAYNPRFLWYGSLN